LYYFQSRDYDPLTGTWREQDPAGAAYIDTMNLYQAFDSAPTDYVDWSGFIAAGAGMGNAHNGLIGRIDPTTPWECAKAFGEGALAGAIAIPATIGLAVCPEALIPATEDAGEDAGADAIPDASDETVNPPDEGEGDPESLNAGDGDDPDLPYYDPASEPEPYGVEPEPPTNYPDGTIDGALQKYPELDDEPPEEPPSGPPETPNEPPEEPGPGRIQQPDRGYNHGDGYRWWENN
jgi:hypothetical protein